jgi:hypothetical protein
MKGTTDNMEHRNRSAVLAVIGVLLLAVGLVAAFLGPIETYCFYLFSEEGRFHYPGFGFGSFMFGNIASQIVGYYLIAALLIPLGYGHLKVRRWARTLSLTLLWFWLVVGVPLVLAFFFVLVTAKDLSPPAALIAVVALAASYLILPGLLIRFYRGRDVRLTFEAQDPTSYPIERRPMPILVLCALHLFYLVALHVPILFRGIFPLFGVFLFDLSGIFLLDVSIALLACLAWGTWRLRSWAWWGSLVYYGVMTSSAVLTLFKSDYAHILSRMRFPPTEMKALQGLPFQGWHFAPLIGLPLAITLGVIALSRRHFGAQDRALNG